MFKVELLNLNYFNMWFVQLTYFNWLLFAWHGSHGNKSSGTLSIRYKDHLIRDRAPQCGKQCLFSCFQWNQIIVFQQIFNLQRANSIEIKPWNKLHLMVLLLYYSVIAQSVIAQFVIAQFVIADSVLAESVIAHSSFSL